MNKKLLFLLLSMLMNVNLFSQWEVKNVMKSSGTLNVLKFHNSEIGFAMGQNGLILKTNDSGESWDKNVGQIEGSIIDFDFISEDNIFLLSNYFDDEESKACVYQSKDGGETWEMKFSTTKSDFSCIQFVDSKVGLISGFQNIYRTIDGGETWETAYDLTENGFNYGEIKKIKMLNDSIGYAIETGRKTGNTVKFSHFVLKTEDGGKSWFEWFEFNSRLMELDFLNTKIGYVATAKFTFKTIDGGITWDTLNNLNSVVDFAIPSQKSVFSVNRPQNYIPERPSTIFGISKSIDAGNSWEGDFANGAHLETVFFLSDSVGFVAGDHSIIMKTENGGGEIVGDYPWDLYTSSSTNSIIQEINFYPNPASLHIQIAGDNRTGIEKLVLTNIDGVVVLKVDFHNDQNNVIDVSNFPNGIYFLEISDKLIKRRSKLIIIH